jgi:Na+/H+ antiporter NhaA
MMHERWAGAPLLVAALTVLLVSIHSILNFYDPFADSLYALVAEPLKCQAMMLQSINDTLLNTLLILVGYAGKEPPRTLQQGGLNIGLLRKLYPCVVPRAQKHNGQTAESMLSTSGSLKLLLCTCSLSILFQQLLRLT